ncbi:MAG: shikimate dehydrogenase [Desulfuromonadaceae bacterium]|nr:shikimate dehydrogenase [Desulfuromonadaceae bacterium]
MTAAATCGSSFSCTVDGHTEVYAILGCPVGHSLSPIMQNAAFAAAGINAIYVPFPVQEGNLAHAVMGLRALAIRGCNVTIPHKEKIAAYLDCLTPEAEAIGAVNTISQVGERLEGHNTDAIGFLHSLKYDLGFSPGKKRIVVLGAGGAARACVYALAHAKAAHICIANRNIGRARSLCRDFSKIFPATTLVAHELDIASQEQIWFQADLIVNTTSIGLSSNEEGPVPWGNINSKTFFYDVVYRCGSTAMVKCARKHGLQAADGLGMLIAQGEQAFRIWTDMDPGNSMRSAIEGFP